MRKKDDTLVSNGVTLKRNKPIRQAYQNWYIQLIVIAIVIALITFSLFPLFITVTNSLKTANEVDNNIFALPSKTIIDAIKHNYGTAWKSIGDKFFPSIIIALIVCLFAFLA